MCGRLSLGTPTSVLAAQFDLFGVAPRTTRYKVQDASGGRRKNHMSSSPPTCSGCGFTFLEPAPRAPCPNCGGTARTFHKHFNARVEIHEGLARAQRRPGFSGWLVKMTDRVKRSRRGLLARETQVYDRSAPDRTVKIHRVEERQPDGSWKTVHDEQVGWPAKRRPKDRP